ncbi:MAG: hypothetical protein LBL96_07595 [Clostridiales bacterium]|jgi:Fe-S-cluster formation regulator IscX/YfhJ|nr:hypothetical protein [Clostridiales bacterium]
MAAGASTPNAETIEALEEADEIARDPNRKHFTTLEALFADLNSYDEDASAAPENTRLNR